MLKIGNVELENNVILAPMAGVCNPSFRILAKEMGAGLVCAEMVATKALQHGNAKTRSMLKIIGEEKPVAMQLVGCDAESMAIAAELVAETEADIIDINMGCPASKIHKAGSGAALARDPESAGRIIEAVVKAAGNKPVTVKFRKGWDDDNINAVAIAKIAEQAGAKSVAVHGRTAKQMYTGHADWDIIKAVKEAVNINVIGNGDITTPQKAVEMLKHTGADGVMIGRGSLGNPWIFKQVAHYIKTGEQLPSPTVEDRIRVALRHADLLVEEKGEYTGTREMRKHIAWYTKGLYESNKFRDEINLIETSQGLKDALHFYLETLLAREAAEITL
ncbi:tRNA dihydrouridine synthase DusB [Tumebacillus permanentifrigoris]|uniref:tRNA-dihydrouridine synthase n=1 Tax=Tumebacillus permanentifrigoris TaxID=378543 RepID=A0A316D601_9BACL|nr:tRNA dihydrouridine synthase DusB [Tumebacillus permanentifrigoris]PWK07844.1 tRNA-U20-dihydrouridine synthase [Tumebacillus permanentifrigoris]